MLLPVRDDQATIAAFEPEALPGEARLQVLPAGRFQEVLAGCLAHQRVERHLPGAFPSVDLAGTERFGAIGAFVPLHPVVVTGHGSERQLVLLLPERALDLRVVVLRIPSSKRLRVYTVDHEVQVRMARIAVGDDQRLVLLEAEVAHEPVCGLDHRRAVDRVLRVEGERDVVDGFLGSNRLRGRRTHEQAGGVRIVGGDVACQRPLDTIGRSPVAAGFEVAGKPGEPPALHDLGDHLPSLRGGSRRSGGRVRRLRRCTYRVLTIPSAAASLLTTAERARSRTALAKPSDAPVNEERNSRRFTRRSTC